MFKQTKNLVHLSIDTSAARKVVQFRTHLRTELNKYSVVINNLKQGRTFFAC